MRTFVAEAHARKTALALAVMAKVLTTWLGTALNRFSMKVVHLPKA